MVTNKLQSFFTIEISYDEKTKFEKDELENNVDLILGSMQCQDEPTIFEKTDRTGTIYMFKTSTRKRKGQLSKFCDRYLEKEDIFTISSLSKLEFIKAKLILNKHGRFKLRKTKLTEEIEYNGEDIKKFEKPNQWRRWQLEIYKMMFEPDSPTIESIKGRNWAIKKADERKIINLVDKKGGSGKSQFFKYLYVKNQKKIGRLGYASASQLRSSVVNLGEKDIYIIDLPRTKARYDSQIDLLSVVEDIKSGIVFNGMYGSGNVLLMKPPHIVICSNYLLDYENLSDDRWKVFEIEEKSFKLNKLNTQTKMKNEKILIKK